MSVRRRLLAGVLERCDQRRRPSALWPSGECHSAAPLAGQASYGYEDLIAIAQALAHPLRLAIVRAVAASAPPLSPARLAPGLGERVPNVAYHVNILARLGVLELVDTNSRRGGVEHLYRLAAKARDRLEHHHVLTPRPR